LFPGGWLDAWRGVGGGTVLGIVDLSLGDCM
jgi:hypothetical protein